MVAAKKIESGMVAFLNEGPLGQFVYRPDPDGDLVLVQFVQDEPDSLTNGDGHYELYEGSVDDYTPYAN